MPATLLTLLPAVQLHLWMLQVLRCKTTLACCSRGEQAPCSAFSLSDRRILNTRQGHRSRLCPGLSWHCVTHAAVMQCSSRVSRLLNPSQPLWQQSYGMQEAARAADAEQEARQLAGSAEERLSQATATLQAASTAAIEQAQEGQQAAEARMEQLQADVEALQQELQVGHMRPC